MREKGIYKVLLVLIVIGFVLSLPVVFGLRQEVNASEDYAENILKDWIERNFGSNYSLKQIIFVTENKGVEGNESYYVIHARILHTLKLKDLNTHPIITAINGYRNLYGTTLSQSSKAFIEKIEKEYRYNLYHYCNEDQELNIRFKVHFSKIEGVSVFIEDPLGEFIKANEYYQTIDSKKLENDFLESLKRTIPSIESHYNEIESTKPLTYSPSLAVYYANLYTSETSLWHWCEENSEEVKVYQDKSKYNPQYIGYYCTDCANYVSQAVHYGGIPTDSIWYPYSQAWNVVDYPNSDNDLFSYMWGRYCWLTFYRPYAIPGSMGMIDWNSNGSPDHATLIVYNDGNVLKFNAHTSDHKNYLLPSSWDVYFLIFY